MLRIYVNFLDGSSTANYLASLKMVKMRAYRYHVTVWFENEVLRIDHRDISVLACEFNRLNLKPEWFQKLVQRAVDRYEKLIKKGSVESSNQVIELINNAGDMIDPSFKSAFIARNIAQELTT